MDNPDSQGAVLARPDAAETSSSIAENAALQEEELVGLEAIFGDDARIERGKVPRCEVHVPRLDSSVKVVVRFELGLGYPSREAPGISVIARHVETEVQEWIKQELDKLFQPSTLPTDGSVLCKVFALDVPVMYECVEWLQGRPELYEVDEAVHQLPPEAASETPVVPEAVLAMGERVVHGGPFTEKKSTFQSHLCDVKSVEEVQAMMQFLLSNNKIRHATHNILAYRIFNPETQAFIQDCDDDGETAAGARLLHLLQVAKVQNVAVCVTRWFGGVLLGPARFSHINNAARELLVEHGYITLHEKKKK